MLGKHYHLLFDTKIGHGICETCCIPCACVGCTSILDWTWIYGIPSKKKARYQPVTNCTYWPVLGSYNNWNIIELNPKSRPYESFEEIHQVVLDRISENMASLVQPGMYGAIDTYETTKKGLYFIKFLSKAYTLQKMQNLWTSYFCWWISCQGTISLLCARKHQLIFETKTTTTEYLIYNTHNNSSTSWCYHNKICTIHP